MPDVVGILSSGDKSMRRSLVPSSFLCTASVVCSVALLAAAPASRASSTFALVLNGPSLSTVEVDPGEHFALDVLVAGLAAEAGV